MYVKANGIAETKAANELDHLAHCERIEIIGEAIEDSSVYLYPFIIEYSIIGISVVYRQDPLKTSQFLLIEIR